MKFQKWVVLIAIILLVVSLILIALVLVNSKKSQPWPPVMSNCPDYWTDVKGDGSECRNDLGVKGTATSGNSATCNKSTMDFTKSSYTGPNGLCGKYQYAHN
jgi:hypothetical protein